MSLIPELPAPLHVAIFQAPTCRGILGLGIEMEDLHHTCPHCVSQTSIRHLLVMTQVSLLDSVMVSPVWQTEALGLPWGHIQQHLVRKHQDKVPEVGYSLTQQVPSFSSDRPQQPQTGKDFGAHNQDFGCSCVVPVRKAS